VSAGQTLLSAQLARLEHRVRIAVERRRGTDPAPDDPFRGLYLSDEAVDELLAAPRTPYAAAGPEAAAVEDRLHRLGRTAGLSVLDRDLFLIAVAPELDSRFEPLYGYLNDDVTRRRVSVGLALRLAGRDEGDPAARARLAPQSPLVAPGLVIVEEAERSWLTRCLAVPDRVAAYLLGDDRPAPGAAAVLDPDASTGPIAEPIPTVAERAAALAKILAAGARGAYLREVGGGDAVEFAATALALAGRAVVTVDARRLARDPDPVRAARAVRLEGVLRDAGLVVGPVDALAELPVTVLRTLGAGPAPTLWYGTVTWEPRWSDELPVQLSVAPLTRLDRGAVWRRALDGHLPEGLDVAASMAHFRLGAGQVHRAAQAARAQAALDGGGLTVQHLRRGARGVNAGGLERLARRIEPGVGWADLVLPDPVVAMLQELCARARLRDQVLDEWRMRPGGGRGRGVAGLFAGDSGTGKTMAAEVIAGALGLDLYTVNLATVVDKYIGETEKNLERIFSEAAGVNGVLLFDEADAIFGKRSEVRDAHDKYANIESAYLLQRMETFDGLAILATNLRANLDDAFTRRLDVIVDFPTPDAQQRRRLWVSCLGGSAPLGSDLDLDFCADSFELSGGNIRSAVIAAAYLAADAGRSIMMVDLIGAIAREYRKLGRLVLEREFGRYLELV
jgi:hypothetical protein